MRVKDMTPEQRKLHNRNLRQARKAKFEADAKWIYSRTGGGPVGMLISSTKAAPAGAAAPPDRSDNRD